MSGPVANQNGDRALVAHVTAELARRHRRAAAFRGAIPDPPNPRRPAAGRGYSVSRFRRSPRSGATRSGERSTPAGLSALRQAWTGDFVALPAPRGGDDRENRTASRPLDCTAHEGGYRDRRVADMVDFTSTRVGIDVSGSPLRRVPPLHTAAGRAVEADTEIARMSEPELLDSIAVLRADRKRGDLGAQLPDPGDSRPRRLRRRLVAAVPAGRGHRRRADRVLRRAFHGRNRGDPLPGQACADS